MTKAPKIQVGEKTATVTNGVGENWTSEFTGLKQIPISHHVQI
jgi:hypothetical protein